MAVYSKKEFSERCGIPTNALAVYVKRGKVILTDDRVDDSLPQNQAFLKKRGGGKRNGKVKQESAAEPRKRVKPEKVPEEVQRSFDLDMERRVIEKDRAELGKQLLQAKLGKTRAELIPFDDVKMSLGQHWRDMTHHMSQGIQNLLTEIAHRTKMNLNQKAELHKAMERVVNDSVNRAIDATQTSLRNIQKEHSVKREVGEKAA